MPRRLDLPGSTVLVTGAARGIGAATARRLHARGANLALVGLEPERLEALAEELGERAAWFEADVTDLAALERAVAGAVARFGGLDVAIANAGVHFNGTLAGAQVAQVERTLEVNLLGVWRTDRVVIPHLRERRGHLVNISSLSAISHTALMGPYTCSKAGVEALTDALRLELRPSGVTVGCAYFGFIDTDLVRGSFADPANDLAGQLMPGFVRRPAPLRVAVDALERGIVRRSARICAPRYVRGALLARGVLQPLADWRTRRSRKLAQAIQLAETSATADQQDARLGVSASVR